MPELKPLRVALIQLQSNDSVDHNEKQIFQLIDHALQGSDVDLVVLPENALFFQVGPFDLQNRTLFSLKNPIFERWNKMVKTKNVALLVGSVPLQEGDRVFNASVFLDDNGDPRVVYRKTHLFDVEVEGEKPVRESDQFAHGFGPQILEVKGWRLGLSICYDLRFPELYLEYGRRQVEALLVPSAFLATTGEAHWEVVLRARAIENQAFVLAPAQGGVHTSISGDRTRTTYGHTMAVDPWGRVIGAIDEPKPEVLVITLDPAVIRQVRRQIPMDQHRRL